MNLLEEMGKKIELQRDKLGLTQKELASLCSISDKAIRYIEQGNKGSSIGNWVKVADKLGLKLELNIKRMSDEERKSAE